MAESRRLEFTTIQENGNDVKKKSTPPAPRFALSLFESTDTKCPEFSFTDLLKNAASDKVRAGQQDANDKGALGDPFEVDDRSEVEAIAKRLEEKYGCKRGRGRHRGDYLKDLVDRGDGYDVTDNFIDDSEAYDELVPAELTTKLGGFYINSGKLEFKYIPEESGEEIQENGSQPSMKRKKANVIDSDSEPDNDFETPKKPKKRKVMKEDGDGEKKKRKKMLSGDGEKGKRGRKPLNKDKLKKKKNSPTVAELLKQQRSTPTSASAGERQDGSFDREGVDGMRDESESQDGEEERNTSNRESSPAALPSSLPADLYDIIQRIKRTAMESSEGKCKFFSSPVNKMLLDIENGSRQLSCGNRSQIFAHLANFLPCSKETLLKRAKALRLNQQNDKLRLPIEKLREAVNKMMPDLQDMHEAECQLAALERQEMKQRDEGEEATATTGESDDEEKAEGGSTKKRVMGPRKKFPWNDELRGLLFDVVKIKMQGYEISKLRTQSAEDYLKAFLDSEIKPLWPQGWMQTRALFKESRDAHSHWTNPKPKKQNIPLTTKSPPSPTLSLNSGISTQAQSNNTGSVPSNVAAHPGRVSPIPAIEVVEIADSSDPDDSPVKKPSGMVVLDDQPMELCVREGDSLPLQGSLPGVGLEEAGQEGRHNLVTGLLQGSLVQAGAGTYVKQDGLPLPAPSPAGSTSRPEKSQTFLSEFERHVASSQVAAAEERVPPMFGSPKASAAPQHAQKQGSNQSLQQRMQQLVKQQQMQQQLQLQQQQMQQQEQMRLLQKREQQKQKIQTQQQMQQKMQQMQQLQKLQQQQQQHQATQQHQTARQHLTQQQQLASSQESHRNELQKQLHGQGCQQSEVPLTSAASLGLAQASLNPGVVAGSGQAKPRLSLESNRRDVKNKAIDGRDEILSRIQRELLEEGKINNAAEVQMQMVPPGARRVAGNSLSLHPSPQTQAGKGQQVTSSQGHLQPRPAHTGAGGSSPAAALRPSVAEIISQSIKIPGSTLASPGSSAPPQAHKVTLTSSIPKTQPQRPSTFQSPMGAASSGGKGMVSLLGTGDRSWSSPQAGAPVEDEVFTQVLGYLTGGRNPSSDISGGSSSGSGRKPQGRPLNLPLTPGSAHAQRTAGAQPRGPGMLQSPSTGGPLPSPRAGGPAKSGKPRPIILSSLCGNASTTTTTTPQGFVSLLEDFSAGAPMSGTVNPQVCSSSLQQQNPYLHPAAAGSQHGTADISKANSTTGAPASLGSPFPPQSLPGLPYWRLFSQDASKSPHGQ